MPALIGPLISALLIGLRWFFLAKAAGYVARLFAIIGIGWATNEYLVEPLIDNAIALWHGIPQQMAQWIAAFRIDEVASILLSGYTILGFRQLFLAKRS